MPKYRCSRSYQAAPMPSLGPAAAHLGHRGHLDRELSRQPERRGVHQRAEAHRAGLHGEPGERAPRVGRLVGQVVGVDAEGVVGAEEGVEAACPRSPGRARGSACRSRRGRKPSRIRSRTGSPPSWCCQSRLGQREVAGDQVTGEHLPRLGHLLRGSLGRARAPGAEAAAGRRVDRRRRLAAQRRRGSPRNGRRRDRVEQRRGVGVQWRCTTDSSGPISQSLPRYMTATRSLRCLTTERSWATKR